MAAFLENEVAKNLDVKLANIAQATNNLNSFANFKKQFPWLAKEFTDQINKFYLNEIADKAKQIKLPPVIQAEVDLYLWIKVRGLQHLKTAWTETFNKLASLRSQMRKYFQFYQNKLQDITNDQNLIFANFCFRWESLLVERIANYQLYETLSLRQKYVSMWTNNFKLIGELKHVVAFAWNFFGRFWEGDLQDFKTINLNVIMEYARILENNPAIMELTKKLGRALGKSDLYEVRLEDHPVIEYEPLPIGKWPEEVVGITAGKELEHLVPLELVNLAIPELQAVFYKKLIEEKLAITEFQSIDLVAKEVIRQQEVRTNIPLEQGPIILCVDTSKSMKNSPEIIAKSLTLAVSKIALEQNRPCYMINFSGVFDTYDLSSLKASIPNLINFLSRSFLGQTNIAPAFNHVLEIMKTHQYHNADLLLISDFLSSNLTRPQVSKMQQLKADRNRFHAINIAPIDLTNNWKQHFTSYYNYDPRDPWAVRKVLLKHKS